MRDRTIIFIQVSLTLILFSVSAVEAVEVFPQLHSKGLPGLPQDPVSSAGAGNLEVHHNIECYGTNMRSISNPPFPGNDLDVVTTVRIKGDKDNQIPIHISFPIDFLDPSRVTSPKGTTSTKADWVPHLVFPSGVKPATPWVLDFNVPRRMDVEVGVKTDIPAFSASLLNDGTRKIDALKIRVRKIDVFQTGMQRLRDGTWGPGGPPSNGSVSAQVSHRFSNNGKILNIHVRVPGALQAGQRKRVLGFCDSFYSPLMLFFDEKKPDFSGVSSFAILPGMGNFAWPEAGAPGYFLALDKDRNGSIDSGEELFGENPAEGINNGFEALRRMDTNHDGHIDVRDKDFNRLTLWGDTNGNGISEKSEMIPISKLGVVDIDLNYNGNRIYRIGGVAEMRESSHFTYRELKTGNLKKGEVFDVWLATTMSPQKSFTVNTTK